MKKILFGIFAHPDDEAFGPSGTLMKEVRAGATLHLITLTSGDAGTNPDGHEDLGAVRLKEWRKAGKLMGATSMHYLGYKDGMLSNNSLLSASEKIEEIIRGTIKTCEPTDEIEFVTFDLNGISGHIDHIVASRAACLVFYRLKKTDKRFRKICLFCIPEHDLPSPNVSWLYMEAGRKESEITAMVDASDISEDIKTIIRIHHTQRSDGEGHIERMGEQIGINHYIVLE